LIKPRGRCGWPFARPPARLGVLHARRPLPPRGHGGAERRLLQHAARHTGRRRLLACRTGGLREATFERERRPYPRYEGRHRRRGPTPFMAHWTLFAVLVRPPFAKPKNTILARDKWTACTGASRFLSVSSMGAQSVVSNARLRRAYGATWKGSGRSQD